MAFIPGDSVKVYVETSKGMITEITGYVKELSYSLSYDALAEVNISIIGNDPVIFSSQAFATKIEEQRRSGEWKCAYCGHINPMSARNCGGEDKSSVGCGAVRSFIYGETKR